MKLQSPVSRRKARIEIIPLIDIVFFLLATFALVSLSMVKNQGLPVHVPKAQTGQAQDLSQVVSVTVSASGRYSLDKQPVSKEELYQHLVELKHQHRDLSVWINGDQNAGFGKAVEALDEVRHAGITKVSIRTQK
jgi:biopolymer transport protein ExbD